MDPNDWDLKLRNEISTITLLNNFLNPEYGWRTNNTFGPSLPSGFYTCRKTKSNFFQITWQWLKTSYEGILVVLKNNVKKPWTNIVSLWGILEQMGYIRYSGMLKGILILTNSENHIFIRPDWRSMMACVFHKKNWSIRYSTRVLLTLGFKN